MRYGFAALILSGAAIGIWSLLSSGCTKDPGQVDAAPAGGSSATRAASGVRAVWIARMHYRYAEDVAVMMRRCRDLGLNTVLWQVRGEGTVTYPSRLEPWAREFDHRDPGFDPLASAVEQAHANGLRLEAWVNVMPGWKGTQPPPDLRQLWHAHPEWFLHDAAGTRQPAGDFYAILNPCLPEVRDYIVSVCEEIVTDYDIDGLHLDYVRYAWDTTPDAKNRYPRDARTLALYRAATGLHPDDDPTAWDRWRADQITQLVRDIRTMLRRVRPDATLTAAVIRDPERAYRGSLQDSATWLRLGLVDALMPMAYTADAASFSDSIEQYRRRAPEPHRVVPGIGLYKIESADALRAQLAKCAAWGGGFALFSYDSLAATHGDRRRVPVPAEVQQLRQMRRDVVQEFTPAGRRDAVAQGRQD